MDHPLRFESDSRWYSEALLPSRFLPEVRGDKLAESFTHADGVIGDFKVDSGHRGDAALLPSANQFIVTEAKVGSPLSVGTKNAPNYDQAARNVACIAYMLGAIDINPKSVKRLGFYVIAPRQQIEAGVFGELVTKAIPGFSTARRADIRRKAESSTPGVVNLVHALYSASKLPASK